ncbi:MAG: Hsp20/alpha crystallin family protein [Solirubrobacterales bacterium]
MYVSVNPNQVIAASQGYHSGATAFPIGVKPSFHGNTITYAFNPALASATVGSAPFTNAFSVNPAISSQAFSSGINTLGGINALNSMNTGNMNQLWNVNAFSQNPAYSQLLASQAFNQNISSGQFNVNSILSSTGIAQMRIDLAETNSDVVVAAELPNVSLNDVILTVTDDSVSITATAWTGTSATSLYRTVALPTTIKAEQCEATYSNGILEVRAPKSDVVTRRKIKVNVSQ